MYVYFYVPINTSTMSIKRLFSIMILSQVEIVDETVGIIKIDIDFGSRVSITINWT